MAECFNIPECGFYHDSLEGMPTSAEFLKMTLYHQEPDACKGCIYLRHKKQYLPENLIPLDKEKVGNLR